MAFKLKFQKKQWIMIGIFTFLLGIYWFVFINNPLVEHFAPTKAPIKKITSGDTAKKDKDVNQVKVKISEVDSSKKAVAGKPIKAITALKTKPPSSKK